MFTAVVVTVTKHGRTPGSPLMEERTNKMWWRYTTDCSSALTRQDIPTPPTTWVDQKDTVLGEISRTCRTDCPIPLMGSLPKSQILRSRKQNNGHHGLGEEGSGELWSKSYGILVGDDGKVLETDGGDGCLTR